MKEHFSWERNQCRMGGKQGGLQMERITLLQFNSRGMILSPGGSQGIWCSCVNGGCRMTLLVAAQPCLSPCMMYVSSLSPVLPTGSVQGIGECWRHLLDTHPQRKVNAESGVLCPCCRGYEQQWPLFCFHTWTITNVSRYSCEKHVESKK